MKSNNNKKQNIVDEINNSISNLTNLNKQLVQYQAQVAQALKKMDNISTSEETLFKLFNTTKENFTGIEQHKSGSNINNPKLDLTIRIPMTGNKMTRVKHKPESSESSYELSSESSIDDKATKRVNIRELQSLYKGNENLYDVTRLRDVEKKKNNNKRDAKFSEKEKKREEKINKNNSQQR